MSNTLRDQNPPERPLAFDGYAAQARRGPAPVTLVLSLLLLAGVGGGVVYLYRAGARAPDGPPAPVGVPIRDVRVAAPPQQAQPDPASGLTIYKDDPNAAAAAPTFAPAPEQPAARPGAPPPVTTVATATSAGPVVAGMAGSAAPPVVVVPPAAKPTKPASIDSLLAETPPATVVKHAEATPPAKIKHADATSPVIVKTADAAPPVTDKHATSTSTGSFVVQIGAFSSQSLADKGWSSAAGMAPGKGKRVAQVTKSDGTTLYRAAITGFDSREEAQAVCAKLTAAGRACFVR
jgi:hypothetical protein